MVKFSFVSWLAGRKPQPECCKANYLGEVKEALKTGESINKKNKGGRDALIYGE